MGKRKPGEPGHEPGRTRALSKKTWLILGPTIGAGRDLSHRARKVFEFILASVSEKGLPPTIREIGEEFRISSTNGVRYYLDVLEKAGFIKRTGKISRGIEVRRELVESLRGESHGLAAASVEIPIVGRVAAGAPILAEENIEDVIAVDKSIARSGRMFALRVRGDSMKESGLLDGDLAIVRQQHHADSGDIVVALLGDEATVKRFVRREGRSGSGRESEVILKPENKDYKPIVVRAGTQFSLIGKVVGSIRKY